eukprot:gene15368-17582_t
MIDDSIDLESFDDGHSPGATSVETKLAVYRKKNSSNFFSIYDNVLPSHWCDRAYKYAVERKKPWGAYITSADALDLTVSEEDIWANNDFERAIALVATRSLFYERAGGLLGPDKEQMHGTAVWCLCSDETDSVQYHIDYAELYRYETNIIYPPLYAGTCQVSPIHGPDDMEGGDFQANVTGVEHYRRFGYKGKLASKEEFQKDLKSSDWIVAKYKHNRAIVHDGNFAHLSTPITHIKPGVKRVILGFNSFPAVLGECCMRAPEHSDAFNRTIKLYQTMAALGVPITAHGGSGNKYQADDTTASDQPLRSAESTTDASASPSASATTKPAQKGMNVKDVLKNPALAKLLVTAARKLKAHDEQKAEEAKRLQQEQHHQTLDQTHEGV